MTASTEAPDRPSTDRRIPDFFLAGQPKSGTTALYEMLRRHPQIFMPDLKEPLFFDRELHPQLTAADPHPSTLEQYLQLFAPAAAAQVKGEASANYLRSRFAAGRIAAVAPHARIIAILREPASFLRSLHLQLLQSGLETETDLRRAIERERREQESKPVLRYADDRIAYVEQLRRYHEAFGSERVLVLVYDDFRADTLATVRAVLEFLGVDPDVPLERSEANPSVYVRSPRAQELLRTLSVGDAAAARSARAAIKAVLPRRLRRGGLRAVQRRALQAEPPPPEEALMLELRRRYRPEVAALSELLGRDLISEWGYEELR